jgi:hypothetical protein
MRSVSRIVGVSTNTGYYMDEDVPFMDKHDARECVLECSQTQAMIWMRMVRKCLEVPSTGMAYDIGRRCFG